LDIPPPASDEGVIDNFIGASLERAIQPGNIAIFQPSVFNKAVYMPSPMGRALITKTHQFRVSVDTVFNLCCYDAQGNCNL